MAAVFAALLIGVLIGALARPILDSYLRWKTARLYASLTARDDAWMNDPLFREPLP